MPNPKHNKIQRNNHEDDHNNNVNGNHHVNNHGEGMEDQHHILDENAARFQHCCIPTGCSDDPIDVADPYDAVKVVCNNDMCTVGNWMHKDCFALWEQSVLSFLRSCGRARSWSEKQRLQNLWTKKGYDLAYKACDCKCGRGHLRKDLDYIPAPTNDNARKLRKNKKKNDKPMPVVSTNHKSGHHNGHLLQNHALDNHRHHQHQSSQPLDKVVRKDSTSTSTNTKHHGENNSVNHNNNNNNNKIKLPVVATNGIIKIASRNRSIDHSDSVRDEVLDNDVHVVSSDPLMLPDDGLRLRTDSVSSTGSAASQASSSGSITSSTGSMSPLSSSPVGGGTLNTKNKKLVETVDHPANSFRHRQDLSAFNTLPRSKQNPYNIHIDGIQEDEDTRKFVLSSLSNKRMTALRCVLCKTHLPVFDSFPLIDGTMFLSPQAYDQFVVQVIWEGRIQFLNAVCISCLEGACEAKCSACKTPWNGSSFVVGTMYTYDIFAAMPCCQKRLTCKHCRRAVIDVSVGLHFYSQYSRMIICPYCKANDYHFIRTLHDTFSMKEPICVQH